MLSERFGFPLYHDELAIDSTVSMSQAEQMLDQAERDFDTDMTVFKNNFKHEAQGSIDAIELNALTKRHMGFYMCRRARFNQCVCWSPWPTSAMTAASRHGTVCVSPHTRQHPSPRRV